MTGPANGSPVTLRLLAPDMTRAETGRLEKKLRNGQIRTFSIDVDYWIQEALSDVRKDRIALGHCPSKQEKALAPRITRAIREIGSNSKLSVRTDALGGGQFRVHLPSSTAAYTGLDSTERTTWLAMLELAAGARIAVISVAVSRGDSSWFRTVLLQASPNTP